MTHPFPAAIREKSTEVFSRPEFQSGDGSSSGWLLRLLIDFFAWLGSLYEQSPFLFWLLLIVCVLLLVLIIAHLVLQIRTVFGASGKRTLSHEEAERQRLSGEYRAEAERRAGAGEYTEAIRFLFLSLVYRFDESGRIGFHKEYTNREYLLLTGDRAVVRESLTVMVDLLDDHWYGLKPSTREQYELCLAAYQRAAAAS